METEEQRRARLEAEARTERNKMYAALQDAGTKAQNLKMQLLCDVETPGDPYFALLLASLDQAAAYAQLAATSFFKGGR